MTRPTLPTLSTGARMAAFLATTVALSACAAPGHQVLPTTADLLEPPAGSQTLTQELANDRCLAPGQAGDSSSRCEAVRDLIAPPPPPTTPRDARDD